MEQQCLAILQRLLSDCGAATLEPSLLNHFYKHCARQPALRHRQLASVSLKTLLYRYPRLRPEIQVALNTFVADQWRRYTTETPLPQVAPDAPQTDAAPTVAHAAPAPTAPPSDDRPALPAMREDWFDRFLNGVRILLFL
ncbi:MAG: hypothetical protein HF981_06150 [Desulfobacteraceae bacterium]|nr:hypothetical protein [Desulfobacteraceae bacterium]MBC2749952.1 hypothetical protein [Desulfobacteraceae bacterium]